MYLFDTDIISNIVKKRPSLFLMDKLKKISKDMQFTTSINISEIYYGAYKSENREKILNAFEEKVFPNINVLPFNAESGKIFGIMRANLEKRGYVTSEPDLRIAAVAKEHKLILITGNTKHFLNIPGIKIENWITKP